MIKVKASQTNFFIISDSILRLKLNFHEFIARLDVELKFRLYANMVIL